MEKKILHLPLREEETRMLRIGDVIYLSGTIYTARDMAHLRMRELSESGQPLPFALEGAAIFHAGPVALPDGNGGWNLSVIGPTTSIRMEPHADFIGRQGIKAIIGKGGMGSGTQEACRHYGYVYLQAAPGCAALLAKGIRRIRNVTWLEMGMPEAVWELEADGFGPLVVAMDTTGESVYAHIRTHAMEKIEEIYPLSCTGA